MFPGEAHRDTGVTGDSAFFQTEERVLLGALKVAPQGSDPGHQVPIPDRPSAGSAQCDQQVAALPGHASRSLLPRGSQWALQGNREDGDGKRVRHTSVMRVMC